MDRWLGAAVVEELECPVECHPQPLGWQGNTSSDASVIVTAGQSPAV
jgi:hypothetical protein